MARLLAQVLTFHWSHGCDVSLSRPSEDERDSLPIQNQPQGNQLGVPVTHSISDTSGYKILTQKCI